MWLPLRRALLERAREASWGRQSAAALALERSNEVLREVMPAELVAHLKPKKVDHGALTVEVDHPAFVHEVRRFEKEIIRKITSDALPINRVQIFVRRAVSAQEW